MAYAECLDPNDVALNYDIQGGGGGGSGNERKKKVSATLSASSEKLVGCKYFLNKAYVNMYVALSRLASRIN